MSALYHVTTKKKLAKYLQHGYIQPPVRAWKFIASAERFSKQTGRRLIIRLVKDKTFVPFEGHRGEALISFNPYNLKGL
jgi:hypothetical protein